MSSEAVNKPLSRRQFLHLTAAAAGGVVLAACAPAAAPTKAPEATVVPGATAAPKVQKITISQWSHVESSASFYQERGELWKKEHPELEVTFDFQTVPWEEIYTKVLANLAAGSGAPDIVAITIESFSRFMKGSIADKGLVDLTELIGDERKKFVEGKWTPYMIKGRIYAVECGLSPCGFFYQPTLLEAAGIKDLPKTWQELTTVAKQLAAQNKAIMPVDDTSPATFQNMFMQRGGHFFEEDGSVALDTAEAIDCLQMIVAGANTDRIFYKVGADSWFGPGTYGAFKDGKVAGTIAADWYAFNCIRPSLPDMAGKWRMALMPSWPKGHKSTTAGGTGWAITTQSKHPDLVYDLIHFAQMTVDGQVKRYQVMGYFPTMYDAMKDPRVIDAEEPYCGGQKVGAVFAEMATDMPIQWPSPYWLEAMKEITDQIVLAFSAEVSPEQAIKTADQNIKAIVAKGE